MNYCFLCSFYFFMTNSLIYSLAPRYPVIGPASSCYPILPSPKSIQLVLFLVCNDIHVSRSNIEQLSINMSGLKRWAAWHWLNHLSWSLQWTKRFSTHQLSVLSCCLSSLAIGSDWQSIEVIVRWLSAFEFRLAIEFFGYNFKRKFQRIELLCKLFVFVWITFHFVFTYFPLPVRRFLFRLRTGLFFIPSTSCARSCWL